MKWGTVIGGWGDIIVELGIFQQRLCDGGGVIVYTIDPAIIDFLKCQSFILDVKVVEQSPGDPPSLMGMAWNASSYPEAMQFLASKAGVSIEDIVNTQINMGQHSNWDTEAEFPIAHHLNLPDLHRCWAQDFVKHLDKPLYLLQPFSYRTNDIMSQWPHWLSLMQWIAADRDKTYLVVGKDWNAAVMDKLPNIINMVNKTPDMMYVMALAELCDGVICTSNSLAHFSVSQKIPSFIICAKISAEPNFIFRKVLHSPSSEVMSYYASPMQVGMLLKERFGIWPDIATVNKRHVFLVGDEQCIKPGQDVDNSTSPSISEVGQNLS